MSSTLCLSCHNIHSNEPNLHIVQFLHIALSVPEISQRQNDQQYEMHFERNLFYTGAKKNKGMKAMQYFPYVSVSLSEEMFESMGKRIQV